ncbi:MAG: PilZ domain-containing protein, partial [Cyanobium sp.]
AAFLLNEGVQAPETARGWLHLDDTALHLPVQVVRRDAVNGTSRLALRYDPLDAASTGSLLRLLYGGTHVELPKARRVHFLDAFLSLVGGIWGANPVVRRY